VKIVRFCFNTWSRISNINCQQSNWSSSIKRIITATKFAAIKHRDQRRKDADQSPYVNHPIQVADILAADGEVEDEDVLIAALLHDTIEDTETTPEELESLFGPTVVKIVLEVTDDKSLEKHVRKRLQVESAPKKSSQAKQIKIADKICNISDITASSPVGWSQERKSEYLDWAEQVISGCRGVNALLDSTFDSALDAAKKRLT